MMLTKAQKRVLDFILKHIGQKGYPPTVREVARAFGYRSPLAAKQHIDALVKKGYLKRKPSISRGLLPVGPSPRPVTRSIPVVGTIRAGSPILASENIEEYININVELFPLEEGFGLRVVGDSMKGAGILEGDIVIVRPEVEPRTGDIVVALVEDEATVKRLFIEDGTVILKPEHPDMRPMRFKAADVRILGKVVGLIRRF
ncbi:MAG: transcriptional repressor LexA [Nitrospirae bacterium]|nr:transcriptional repressor LexA [Nitrospirota bacterium]